MTYDSLANLIDRWETSTEVANSLTVKLASAQVAVNRSNKTNDNILSAFQHEITAQTGKTLTAEHAQILYSLAEALK